MGGWAVIIRIRQAVKQGHAPFVVVTSNFASSPSSSYYCRVPNRFVHKVRVFAAEQDSHIRRSLTLVARPAPISSRLVSVVAAGIARNRSPL